MENYSVKPPLKQHQRFIPELNADMQNQNTNAMNLIVPHFFHVGAEKVKVVIGWSSLFWDDFKVYTQEHKSI